MVQAIQQQPIPAVVVRNESPLSEGLNASASKIGAYALSLLAAIVSFFILPLEGALAVLGGLAVLLALCCCRNEGPNVVQTIAQRVIRPAVNAITYAHPVVNPGPRIQVGNVRPYIAPVPIPAVAPIAAPAAGPHVPVGHRNRPDRPDRPDRLGATHIPLEAALAHGQAANRVHAAIPRAGAVAPAPPGDARIPVGQAGGGRRTR